MSLKKLETNLYHEFLIIFPPQSKKSAHYDNPFLRIRFGFSEEVLTGTDERSAQCRRRRLAAYNS